MRVLLIKLSSLGDVVHLLPALTDARAALPGVQFDWVVERGFVAIPAWHPAVDRVIPIALRQWRKAPFQWAHGGRVWGELRAFHAALRTRSYDLVIDAQGLIKSTIVASLARGERAGFDQASAREPLASIGYRHRYAVVRNAHAIDRLRNLLAQALGYTQPPGSADYGLVCPPRPIAAGRPYIVLLHGTTWRNKRWPIAQWRELVQQALAAGFAVLVPCVGADERGDAETITEGLPGSEILADQSLSDIGAWLAHADGVVGVDTGLAHLAAALGTPTITLHGPTDARRTGVRALRGTAMSATLSCAPCAQRVCALGGLASLRPGSIVGACGVTPCMTQFQAPAVWLTLRIQMQTKAQVQINEQPNTQVRMSPMPCTVELRA